MLQSFFAVAEKPKLGLIVTVTSGFANMILDAVLVILPPQEIKLAGAAVATAVSQIVGGVIPLFYFFRKNSSTLRLGKTRYDGKAVIKACTNGASEFMSNISFSIVGIIYNLQLMKYEGEDGIAAFGVMMYVSMIFIAMFIGHTIGTAPIIGYNYGSRNNAELKSLLQKSLVLMFSFGIIMVVVAQLLAALLAEFFVGYDKGLMNLTVNGFRILSLSFLFIGFGVFISGFFTSLSDGLTSAIIAFFRALIFQVGAVMLLPIIFGINGV